MTPQSIPDRDALAIGVRIQLSWVKYAPYTQRADLSIDDRLATIVERVVDGWLVEDERGERHLLEESMLEVANADPAAGRWRLEGAVPAYRTGERLLLFMRYRSLGRIVDPPIDDGWATVIAERPSTVTARLDDGTTIELFRWGAQADEPDRKAPRWFVKQRG